MLRPKKNSYKEFDNEKKFLRLKNSPPPPHNFSNGPSLRVDIGFWPLEKWKRPVRDSLKETNVHELKAVGGNKLWIFY